MCTCTRDNIKLIYRLLCSVSPLGTRGGGRGGARGTHGDLGRGLLHWRVVLLLLHVSCNVFHLTCQLSKSGSIFRP